MTKVQKFATLNGRCSDVQHEIELPKGADLNDWFAENTLHFFEMSMMMHEILEESDLCTATTCPHMSAGKNIQYHWADGKDIKEPIDVSGPQYIEYMFCWVDDLTSDPKIFPEEGKRYPFRFRSTISNILKRLFRVYAHIYHNHIIDVKALAVEAHLNSSFKHMCKFILHFDLVPMKEMDALKRVITKLEIDGWK
eukprot:723545_1